MISSIALAASCLFATVAAHGNITFPASREPGPAMVQACGQEAVDVVLGDPTIAIEELKNTPSTCRVDLCRGAVFEDNKDRVSVFLPGQLINLKAILPIPHEGPMNVSIVRTASNTIVGEALIVFDSYADENLAELPANNTDFDITIPTNLPATACRIPGECVLQWFWFGTGAKQTYESCVDFIIAPTRIGNLTADTGARGSPARGNAPAGSASPVASAAPSVATVPVAAVASAPAGAPEPSFDTVAAPVEGTAEVTVVEQPADVVGGVVGTISVDDAAPQVKRKREFRAKQAAGAETPNTA